MDTSTVPSSTRPAAATLVGVLALVGVVGAIIMAVAHLGAAVPGVTVGRVVAPVAAGLAVGAVLYALVAYGVFRRKPWAWPAALAVNAVALAATLAPPQRGGFEYVPIAISILALGVLVSRPGREALLTRD